MADTLNRSKSTKQSPEVLQTLRKRLRIGWALESISYRFFYWISSTKTRLPTTVYDGIDKDRKKGGKLYTYLPRYTKRRWKDGKRKRVGVAFIPDRVDISERPAIVNERTRIGDGEGDTVYGQHMHTSLLWWIVPVASRFVAEHRRSARMKLLQL